MGKGIYAIYIFISGAALVFTTNERLNVARQWRANSDWAHLEDKSRFQSATARARWVRYVEVLHVKLLRGLKRHKFISTYAIAVGALVDTVVLAFFAGDNSTAGILLTIDVCVKITMQLFATHSSLKNEDGDLDRQEREAKKAISDIILVQRHEKKQSQAEEDPHTRADKIFEDFAQALGGTDSGGAHYEELVRRVRSHFASVGSEARVGDDDDAQRLRRASLIESRAVPAALAGTRFIEQYEGLGGTTRS